MGPSSRNYFKKPLRLYSALHWLCLSSKAPQVAASKKWPTLLQYWQLKTRTSPFLPYGKARWTIFKHGADKLQMAQLWMMRETWVICRMALATSRWPLVCPSIACWIARKCSKTVTKRPWQSTRNFRCSSASTSSISSDSRLDLILKFRRNSLLKSKTKMMKKKIKIADNKRMPMMVIDLLVLKIRVLQQRRHPRMQSQSEVAQIWMSLAAALTSSSSKGVLWSATYSSMSTLCLLRRAAVQISLSPPCTRLPWPLPGSLLFSRRRRRSPSRAIWLSIASWKRKPQPAGPVWIKPRKLKKMRGPWSAKSKSRTSDRWLPLILQRPRRLKRWFAMSQAHTRTLGIRRQLLAMTVPRASKALITTQY